MIIVNFDVSENISDYIIKGVIVVNFVSKNIQYFSVDVIKKHYMA